MLDACCQFCRSHGECHNAGECLRSFEDWKDMRYRTEATVIDNDASGHADTEPDGRMQWVACEACGGTGEIVKGPPGEPYNEYAVLCPVCDGHGIDCEPR